VQYADDMMLIMPADAKQHFFLKCLLQTFAVLTGLKVNFHKSFIVPINMDVEKTTVLAGTLGCSVQSMPFTYLGLPLGTTKPVVQDFMPILSPVEKRLMGISHLTSYSRQLTLVNAVLSALLTFYMCILQLPLEVIDQINKYRRHCL
jgi:hypothetical protein